jgi:phage terminase small subunit
MKDNFVIIGTMKTEVALIETPDPIELGPAMLALTEMQQRFVYALVEYGGDATKAAAHAGYSKGNGNHQSVAAHRNMHDPRVLLAIREEADKRIRGGALLGASVLIELTKYADKDSVRLKAAVELLNRTGLSFVQKHEVVHKDERSDRELEAYITLIARKHGLRPVELLGYDPEKEAIDADFEDVTGEEGLEDLL